MLPKPSVKSITEFIQIFLEIFMRNTMKGPIQKGFQITHNGMEQGQPGRSLFWKSYFLIIPRPFFQTFCRQRMCHQTLSAHQKADKYYPDRLLLRVSSSAYSCSRPGYANRFGKAQGGYSAFIRSDKVDSPIHFTKGRSL